MAPRHLCSRFHIITNSGAGLQLAAGGVPIPVAETGIAWPVDLEKKYGTQNAANFNDVPALRGGAAVTGPLRANEHLVVWMRTAALPAFRKLWGRVLQDLPAGAIVTVSIANRHAP